MRFSTWGETILLDGEPLSLVTRAGVEASIEKGNKHGYLYDQVHDPLDGQWKRGPFQQNLD